MKYCRLRTTDAICSGSLLGVGEVDALRSIAQVGQPVHDLAGFQISRVAFPLGKGGLDVMVFDHIISGRGQRVDLGRHDLILRPDLDRLPRVELPGESLRGGSCSGCRWRFLGGGFAARPRARGARPILVSAGSPEESTRAFSVRNSSQDPQKITCEMVPVRGPGSGVSPVERSSHQGAHGPDRRPRPVASEVSEGVTIAYLHIVGLAQLKPFGLPVAKTIWGPQLNVEQVQLKPSRMLHVPAPHPTGIADVQPFPGPGHTGHGLAPTAHRNSCSRT